MADRFLTDAEQLAIAALHAVVSEDVAKMTPEEREAAMEPIKVEIRRRIKIGRTEAVERPIADALARAEHAADTRGEALRDFTIETARILDVYVPEGALLEVIRNNVLSRATALRNERDRLRARVGELEADVDELRARCGELEADVDELQRLEKLLRVDRDALRIQRSALRASVEELEVAILNQSAEPLPAYHAALEGLRSERDALRAEVMRLRRHLSPPVDEAGAPCEGGGSVPTYRERPRPGNVKPRPDLLPAEALLAAGECLADRTDRDVGSLPWFDRAPLAETLPKYRASLMRHTLAYYADDKVDPESHRPALAHVIVNASILYRLENRAIAARQGTES